MAQPDSADKKELRRMPEPRRTGLPDIDALVEVREREQAKLDEHFVVSTAEGTVANLRHQELAAQAAAARRRLSAAKGLLTKARKDGSAAKLVAGRQRADAASAEFDRIWRANLTEMQSLLAERLQAQDELLEQMGRSWDDGAAVTDALARPRPPHNRGGAGRGGGGAP
jgi:hypothetical protein